MKHLLKPVDIPKDNTSLKLVHKRDHITDPSIISNLIGRCSKEVLERKPPVFNEEKRHLVRFYTSGLRWVHTVIKTR